MRANELARKLKAKRMGRFYSCRCPAHDDHSPSLSFWDGYKDVAFKCHAGCDPCDVIDVLRARGIWQDDRRRA
jgi:putative DNA primase/helicase